MVKSILKAAVWLIGSVIIPATVWFTMLKQEVVAQEKRITTLEVRSEKIEEKALTREEVLAKKLEDIQRSLGRIEGRLPPGMGERAAR